ncbi:hypothetical protein [Faecalibacillus intestinalis]|uniref:hypothetical protein n=1 Tax=Faecalibacillus intestinalis TaxID=1982626 RepID=UPI0039911F0E
MENSLNRFKKNKGAVIGLICILVIAVFAILHQCFHHINLMQSIQKLQVFRHVLNISLGTDTYGRDLFVRVWTGTRYSLFIAVVAIFIDVIVGMTYGLISGYFGGKVDSVMQEFKKS